MLTLVLLFQLSGLASTSNILLCRKGKCPYEVGHFWPPSSHPSTGRPKAVQLMREGISEEHPSVNAFQ